jgi:histidine triad (HIT) family protein
MADCLFCKIVAGEIPATIVKRSADAVAFRDIDPRAPTHVLIIPTQHVVAVRDARGGDGERVLGRTLAFAAQVATDLGLDAGGYRIVTNTGKGAGQSVDHLHFHVLGGRKFTWPPG